MSDTRLPGLANLRPSKKLARVTSISLAASGVTSPQGKVPAQSPLKPWILAPTSMLTMSPSLTLYAPGKPWMTSSLTEMQALAGNPPYPRKDGIAPDFRMNRFISLSISFVVTPAETICRPMDLAPAVILQA